MAQAHRRLGARVTVLEAFGFLAKDDPELSAIVVARLRSEGVDLRANVKIARVERAAVRHRRDPGRRRAAGGIAPAGGNRPRAQRRGPRPRQGRRRLHQTRHHGRRSAQNLQPQCLGDRRLQRSLCLHAHGRLRSLAVHPRRAVPGAREARSRDRAVGDLHRSRAGAGRPQRKRGTQAAWRRRSGCCAGNSPRTIAPRRSGKPTGW